MGSGLFLRAIPKGCGQARRFAGDEKTPYLRSRATTWLRLSSLVAGPTRTK